MTHQPRRGRPVGPGKNDEPDLCKVADYIVEHGCLLAEAVRHAELHRLDKSAYKPSWITRIRRKFRADEARLMGVARARANVVRIGALTIRFGGEVPINRDWTRVAAVGEAIQRAIEKVPMTKLADVAKAFQAVKIDQELASALARVAEAAKIGTEITIPKGYYETLGRLSQLGFQNIRTDALLATMRRDLWGIGG